MANTKISYLGKKVYIGIDVHKETYSVTSICDGLDCSTINPLSQSNAQAFSCLNFPPGLPATIKFPHPPPTYRTIFQQSRKIHGKHPTPTNPQAKLRHSRRAIRLITLEV